MAMRRLYFGDLPCTCWPVFAQWRKPSRTLALWSRNTAIFRNLIVTIHTIVWHFAQPLRENAWIFYWLAPP